MSEDLIKRIERLEESHSFAEHTADQISGQLREAFRALDALNKRLDRLEGRVSELAEPADPEPDEGAAGG